jgi:hypothetical protein
MVYSIHLRTWSINHKYRSYTKFQCNNGAFCGEKSPENRQTHIQIYRHVHSKIYRQTDIHTGRQADRQTGSRETDGQIDGRTDRQTDRQTNRHTDIHTDRQTGIKPIVPSGYTGRGLKLRHKIKEKVNLIDQKIHFVKKKKRWLWF